MSNNDTIIYGIKINSLDEATTAIFEHAKQHFGFVEVGNLLPAQKREVVLFMIHAGCLHLRNAVFDMARLLDTSRTTVYAIIKKDLYSR